MVQYENGGGCPPSQNSASPTLGMDIPEMKQQRTPDKFSRSHSYSSATTDASSKQGSEDASPSAASGSNKWASVLDEDVMAQALAAVRAHRSQDALTRASQPLTPRQDALTRALSSLSLPSALADA
ncbi:hypothetical protein T484DRAFT_1920637 [Baffinella frigidus]|nr:hypothetical protein T484DRAFT_1920637 [Cryptophyta sp. CCMP2293]